MMISVTLVKAATPERCRNATLADEIAAKPRSRLPARGKS
jgi:hypothetical protein